MFRAVSKPLSIPRAVKLSHTEWRSTDNGVERVKVDDCRFLCDPDDLDLEVQMRSGENLKALPTCLKRGGIVINDVASKDVDNDLNNNGGSDNAE